MKRRCPERRLNCYPLGMGDAASQASTREWGCPSLPGPSQYGIIRANSAAPQNRGSLRTQTHQEPGFGSCSQGKNPSPHEDKGNVQQIEAEDGARERDCGPPPVPSSVCPMDGCCGLAFLSSFSSPSPAVPGRTVALHRSGFPPGGYLAKSGYNFFFWIQF